MLVLLSLVVAEGCSSRTLYSCLVTTASCAIPTTLRRKTSSNSSVGVPNTRRPWRNRRHDRLTVSRPSRRIHPYDVKGLMLVRPELEMCPNRYSNTYSWFQPFDYSFLRHSIRSTPDIAPATCHIPHFVHRSVMHADGDEPWPQTEVGHACF